MPLFHPRIIEKYTKNANPLPPQHLAILSAWATNLAKGVFDRETSHDSEFIQRILIDVLGYKGSSSGAECTVGKNQPLGKGNVDTALGYYSEDVFHVVAPFELKGAKTRDLDAIMPGRNKSPVQQAWEYGMDAKGAKWVLVSNYREIRLYAIGYGRKDYEAFDLAKLTDPAAHARFILLLSAASLLGEQTINLLKESENKNKEITDRFYKDYKALRGKMVDTLTKDNPTVPSLEIIQHTQTILDRILFVAFSDGRGLLPKDTLKSCYEDRGKWNPQPAWENFKGLFNSIDKGNPPLNIPGYNGGLFAHNARLDSLKVSDAICEGFKDIGGYDYESDVSVNILGHIFEQSISDLEEIKATANGNIEVLDGKKSKRKKDGIFYTPPYITRYIVEQAVGGWLNDRKQELGFYDLPEITDEELAFHRIDTKSKSFTQKITQEFKNKRQKIALKIKKHVSFWEVYKEKLKSIKVLDPACGSGAFLNEVFDFLSREGKQVNEQLIQLTRQETTFRWDAHILANNIYGVDINQESVEITKLSLWLKTANRNEKLTYLDDNIKCGNSLIDDPAVASNLAFKWEDKFSKIMRAGGFDVILGNPPWGAKLSENEKAYIKNRYTEASQGKVDSYRIFIQKCLLLLKPASYLSFITPNTFLYNIQSKDLRFLIFKKHKICSAIELRKNIFDDAPDVVPVVFTLTNTWSKKYDFIAKVVKSDAMVNSLEDTKIYETIHLINSKIIEDDPLYKFNLRANLSLHDTFQRISKNSSKLNDLFFLKQGTKIIDKENKDTSHLYQKSESSLGQGWEKAINGRDISRYYINYDNFYIKRSEDLHSCLAKNIIAEEKIYFQRMRKISLFPRIVASYDDNELHGLYTCSVIYPKDQRVKLKYLLAILNSRLINLWYKNYDTDIEIKLISIGEIPIKELDYQFQIPFIKKTELMLLKRNELEELNTKLFALMTSDLGLKTFNKKLSHWYILNFSEFLSELKKQKINLTLDKQSQWMDYFERQKLIATALEVAIDTADHEIDQMVYALYDLNPEEIAMIETVK